MATPKKKNKRIYFAKLYLIRFDFENNQFEQEDLSNRFPIEASNAPSGYNFHIQKLICFPLFCAPFQIGFRPDDIAKIVEIIHTRKSIWTLPQLIIENVVILFIYI